MQQQGNALARLLATLGRPEQALPSLSHLNDAELDKLHRAIEEAGARYESDMAHAFGRILPQALRDRLWRGRP